MKDFVHLHVHTEYSLLDGAARIGKVVKVAKEMGMKAIAITDHGNMYGALQMYEECLKQGMKPIIGCEFYACDDLKVKSGKNDAEHLILLAKNNAGYKNLLKLNAIAFKEGFYYKPRIDYKTLENYSDGIICLSACLAGKIPQLILAGRNKEAKDFALYLKNMFENGDFYLEIQNHNLPEDEIVNSALAIISQQTEIKLVGTNDVHYIYKEDSEMQDILMCVQMGKTFDDPNRLKFSTQEFYLKTREEMEEALKGYEEALDTTNEIAEKCDVVIRSKSHGDIPGIDDKYVLPASENFIPAYVPEDGSDTYEFLRRMCFDGLKKKYGDPIPQPVIDRAEMELAIIKKQGFVEYFLVVWDYVNWARSSGIPVGPGRGSGAGSIVAYSIGITLLDPLKYDLLFERFINKDRVSMPDFDIDFCYDRRLEVVEYARRRYTPGHVAMIVTFGRMQAKNAIRDVARVLRMPYSEVDKITKEIPNKLPEGIKKPPVLKYYFGKTGKPEDEKFIIPELQRQYESDPEIKKIIDMAIKLEGMPRNTSIHAAGVVIAPDNVEEFVPLAKNGSDVSTQYDMIELEHLGLLKMDFLGLRTLTDIDKAIKLVKQNYGIDIDFYNMEYDDPKVYELISSGNTDAIFQLESGGMKKFMKELKPGCLEDIVAGVSLYRPGPMDSIPEYIKNKQNPDGIVYDSEILRPILDVTYGCLVYQEQVMRVVQDMGGYNLAQADNVRRIMGKKKKEAMALEKDKFINGWKDPKGLADICGAVSKGVPVAVAEKVFANMESFASYAFNKSHAAAYSFLTYQTAYLKCYYPTEFLAAVINNRITSADEIKKYVIYARKQKYEVLPPDINKSETYFSAKDGKLRFGLAGLKNVGVGVVESIIEERNRNGDYKDFMDFAKRVDTQALNKRCLESLILSGAFDCFKKKRSQLMQVYELVVDRVSSDKKSKESGQFSLFDDDAFSSVSTFNEIQYPNIKEFNKDALLKFEKEVVGVYISGSPLDDYIDKYKDYNFTSDMLEGLDDENETEEEPIDEEFESGELVDNMQVICGGLVTGIKKVISRSSNKEMGIITIEDMYGTFDTMLFANAWAKYKNIILEDLFVTIKGKLSMRDGKTPIIVADSITPLKKDTESEEEENDEKLYLRLDVKNEKVYNLVDEILMSYPGKSPVVIKDLSTGNAFVVKNRNVKISDAIISELIGQLGEQNVVRR